jgi:hypothetical protein
MTVTMRVTFGWHYGINSESDSDILNVITHTPNPIGTQRRYSRARGLRQMGKKRSSKQSDMTYSIIDAAMFPDPYVTILVCVYMY